MRPLAHWFGFGDKLAPPLRRRVGAWQAIAPAHGDLPFGVARYVVVDTETSGLDPRADRLLSIGAVGLSGRRIALSDAFETVLRQARPSAHANIVIHGIGADAQRDGDDPCEALTGFLEFCGKAPLVAFHAPFDEAFLGRSIRAHLGVSLRLPWLDLAVLLPLLFDAPPRQPLDAWLARFDIPVALRHAALGDALATAQLAQVALARAGERGILSHTGLMKLAVGARWLNR